MSRRRFAVTLLVVLSVQMLGAMVFASSCPEPCSDDAESTSCRQVCVLCASCTHAQAIVQQTAGGAPLTAMREIVPARNLEASPQLTADIFHVPLFG